MRLLAVTIAAGLAVTACASEQPTVEPGGQSRGVTGAASNRPEATSTPSPVDSRCPAGLTENGQTGNSQAKPVPSDIEVDWVLRCTVVSQQGQPARELLIERSDSDPAALLRALRASDEPRNDGPCPAIAMVVPYFALVPREGKPLLARMPLTACSLPQAATMQALDGLRWKVIAKKALP